MAGLVGGAEALGLDPKQRAVSEGQSHGESIQHSMYFQTHPFPGQTGNWHSLRTNKHNP